MRPQKSLWQIPSMHLLTASINVSSLFLSNYVFLYEALIRDLNIGDTEQNREKHSSHISGADPGGGSRGSGPPLFVDM